MNDKKRTVSIGERLYTLREEHKFSQDDLAEKLGVSRQTISNWENDKVKIDVIKATEICRLYGISMDELFMEKETAVCAQDDKKPFLLRLCFLIVGAVFTSALIAVATVLLCLPADNAVSSAIYLSRQTGCIIAVVVGSVALIVLLYFIIKQRLKK